MAVSNPERKILVMALVSVVAVSVRELKAGNVPPPPSAYVGTAIVYGFAQVIAEASGQLGVTLAFAWTLFIGYSLVGDRVTPRRRVQTTTAKAAPKPTKTKTPRAPARTAVRPRHRGQLPSRQRVRR